MASRTLLTFSIVAAGTAARAAESKIGYVDLQRVLAETDEGKKAKSALENVFKQKQTEIDKELTKVKREQEEYEKQKTLLQPPARQEKERQLAEKMQSLRELYLKHQEDLSKREAEAMKDIFRRTEKILQKIAAEEGISMILEKTQSSILWAQPALDLTNELVRRYNAGGGK
ncbi:MAG: OmpH family outer membrane protein [Myxococcota bacterium]